MNKSKLIYPLNLGLYVLGVSLVFVLILEISIAMKYEPSFTGGSELYNIFYVLKNISMSIIVFSLIFFGLNAKVHFRLGMKGLLLPLVSLSLATIFAYIEYEQNLTIKKMGLALHLDLAKIEDRIDRHLFRHNTIADQVNGSNEFAEAVYNELGQKIDVMAPNGRYIRFEPSEKSIQLYQNKQKNLLYIENINVYFPLYYWIMTLLLSIFLSVVYINVKMKH